MSKESHCLKEVWPFGARNLEDKLRVRELRSGFNENLPESSIQTILQKRRIFCLAMIKVVDFRQINCLDDFRWQLGEESLGQYLLALQNIPVPNTPLVWPMDDRGNPLFPQNIPKSDRKRILQIRGLAWRALGVIDISQIFAVASVPKQLAAVQHFLKKKGEDLVAI